MEQLTEMEFLQAKELLDALELATKKALTYSAAFGDGDLQDLARRTAGRHREQLQQLLDQVRRHSGRSREAMEN